MSYAPSEIDMRLLSHLLLRPLRPHLVVPLPLPPRCRTGAAVWCGVTVIYESHRLQEVRFGAQVIAQGGEQKVVESVTRKSPAALWLTELWRTLHSSQTISDYIVRSHHPLGAQGGTITSKIVGRTPRMSCNGCRVLRKGCSESCILRPCLQWIESADAQGHATVFVAKFFGRSGLMGFISVVPPNQRPAVFQSLLYEACGRTVNPVFGAVGLLWAGNWAACQAAVETVLKGGTLRPPSPSSLSDGGISSLPNLAAAGATFAAPCGQEEKRSSCPTTEAGSGLSLATNEKSNDCFKNVREVRETMRERVNPPSARFGGRQAQLMMQQPEIIVESRLPEMNGDSSEVNRQWVWRNQKFNQPASNLPFRLDLSHVQLARAGCGPTMAKEEEVEDLRRTDGPLVLAPVARRVRPRTDVPDVSPKEG
ncbi:hypothetical protein R1flu_006512 [Riccia fluitans]|uniref:LOB domain-containing protein n=1 Tax=Riccia fluitans TaxID=41844 RepID=A0ABD1YWY6_9MARC